MKVKSDEGRRIAKLNKYPHKLGSGGYEGKSLEWAKVLDQNKHSDSPVVRIQNPRAQWWLMGRSEVTADGTIVLPSDVQPVAQKMVRVFVVTLCTLLCLLL